MKLSLPSKDKLTLFTNLSYLLNGGIPILSSLIAINKDSTGNLKKVTNQMVEDIGQGKKIYESMSRYPYAFDKLTISLLKTGEESGNLEVILKELSNKIKKDIEFVNQLKAAMAYPIFVFILTIFILSIILTFVVPKISQVFLKLNLKLNIATKLIMWTSETVLNYYPIVIALLIIFIILLVTSFKFIGKHILNILFYLPFVSNLVKYIDLTVFTRNMGLMLKSGVPIENCLELSENIVNIKQTSRAIKKIREVVSEGKPMSMEIANHPKIFPHMMFQIIEISERSGTLENAFTELSEQYDEISSNNLKTITSLIEPFLIAFVGIIVGGILLSIIAPIYQLIGQIGPRTR